MRCLIPLLAVALASPLAWAAPPASAPSRPASVPLPDEPGAPRASSRAGKARATELPLPRSFAPSPTPTTSGQLRLLAPSGRSAVEAQFRFDALRIDGTLRGPEALVIDSGLSRAGKSLTRLRRSFVYRVFETVEAPGLHGGH